MAAVTVPVSSTIARTMAGNVATPTSAVQSPGTSNIPTAGTMVSSPARRAGPAVVPPPNAQLSQPPVPQPSTTQPNLMQKFSEMTAPGGDILSKGKELIFMKFGLGGK